MAHSYGDYNQFPCGGPCPVGQLPTFHRAKGTARASILVPEPSGATSGGPALAGCWGSLAGGPTGCPGLGGRAAGSNSSSWPGGRAVGSSSFPGQGGGAAGSYSSPGWEAGRQVLGSSSGLGGRAGSFGSVEASGTAPGQEAGWELPSRQQSPTRGLIVINVAVAYYLYTGL